MKKIMLCLALATLLFSTFNLNAGRGGGGRGGHGGGGRHAGVRHSGGGHRGGRGGGGHHGGGHHGWDGHGNRYRGYHHGYHYYNGWWYEYPWWTTGFAVGAVIGAEASRPDTEVIVVPQDTSDWELRVRDLEEQRNRLQRENDELLRAQKDIEKRLKKLENK
jgi:hypothetical protein